MHAPVWFALQTALADIFTGGFPADRVLQRQFKANPKFGSHDRRLFAEATYDIVRWWRRLHFAAELDFPSLDFAGVTRAWCALNNVGVPARVDVTAAPVERLRARWADASVGRASRYSVADWFDAWGLSELGERWPAVLAALNETAPVFLRANRLRTTPEALRAELARTDITSQVAGPDALRLDRRANVFLNPLFKRGWFEVQDLSSQLVADWVDARPGDRVIDACAGAGGKSLHLAARMQNRGRIVALDVTDRKLEELRRRARRAGATCLETKVIEGTKTIKRLRESADRVLLDVPCTGAGILRRNPDAKWRLHADDVARVTRLQGEILADYASMCKPGGTLVYSTCSIMPSENQAQVDAFLARSEIAWTLDKSETIYPRAGGGDGFFIARLRRPS